MAAPVSRIELRFACKSLPKMDILSPSDPQIYIYSRFNKGQPVLMGKTEMIQDCPKYIIVPFPYLNASPVFATPILVDYYFEEVQNLRFVVVDVDEPTGRMEDQDYIGSLDITLASIGTIHPADFLIPSCVEGTKRNEKSGEFQTIRVRGNHNHRRGSRRLPPYSKILLWRTSP
jgi:hypothetical protein